MVHLTDEHLDALRGVRAVWPTTDIVLIGAHALGAHIDLTYRDTDDLDLAVAVSLDSFPAGLSTRPGWRRHPHMEHRF